MGFLVIYCLQLAFEACLLLVPLTVTGQTTMLTFVSPNCLKAVVLRLLYNGLLL
jgi:hypothetical protein